jgi:hypothetical protein
MNIISHRGNIENPIPEMENATEYIDNAIMKGYDVEIDLRLYNDNLYLGHDTPQYLINYTWLLNRSDKLWIHAKDYDSLIFLTECSKTADTKLKYFYHFIEDFTILSNGYIWAHNIHKKMNKYCIVPLLSENCISTYDQTSMFAVCTDYCLKAKEKYNV